MDTKSTKVLLDDKPLGVTSISSKHTIGNLKEYGNMLLKQYGMNSRDFVVDIYLNPETKLDLSLINDDLVLGPYWNQFTDPILHIHEVKHTQKQKTVKSEKDIWKQKSLNDYSRYMTEQKMEELKGNDTWEKFYKDVLSSYKLVKKGDRIFVTNMIEEIEDGKIIDINLLILEKDKGDNLYTFENPHENPYIGDRFPYFTNKSKALKYWSKKYQPTLGKLGTDYHLTTLWFIESTRKYQPYGYISADL